MTSGSGATMIYDEANRIFSAAEISGGIDYYAYTADNKRFYKYTVVERHGAIDVLRGTGREAGRVSLHRFPVKWPVAVHAGLTVPPPHDSAKLSSHNVRF